MKKLFFLFGFGVGGYWAYKTFLKAKAVKTDITRLLFSLSGVGKPVLSQGFLTLPLSISIANQNAAPLSVPKIGFSVFASLFLTKKDGTKELVFSGSPQIQAVGAIPAGGVQTFNVQLKQALTSVLTNIFGLGSITGLELTLQPRALNQDFPEITQKIDFTPHGLVKGSLPPLL